MRYGMHFGEGFVLISVILQHLLSVQNCRSEGSWLDFVACHVLREMFLILLIACCGFCCTQLTCALSLSNSRTSASQEQAYAHAVLALGQPLKYPFKTALHSVLLYIHGHASPFLSTSSLKGVWFLCSWFCQM